MRQLLEIHAREGCSVLAVERVPSELTSSYGVVKIAPVAGGGSGGGAGEAGRLHQILDLVEKPKPGDAPSNLAIIGRYVLTPEIFAHIEKTVADARGEIQLTNALRSLLSEQRILAYEFTGKRYDTGNKLGFLKATVEYALKRPDLGREFREYLKGLKLD